MSSLCVGPRECSLSLWYNSAANNASGHAVCVDRPPSNHVYKLLINPDFSAGWTPPPEMAAVAATHAQVKHAFNLTARKPQWSTSPSGAELRKAIVRAWVETQTQRMLPSAQEVAAFEAQLNQEEYALFDLSVDEAERNDLAQTATGATKIAELRVILEGSLQDAVEPCATSAVTCSATEFSEGMAWVPWGTVQRAPASRVAHAGA